MGREARRVERAGPRARRRGDATPNPTGRAERAGQDRERRTRPVQPAGERAPGSTHGAETAQAASGHRAARQASAGAAAARVPAHDVRADRAQEEFNETKMLAEEKHRKHIEHIRQVHDYDKIIHGIWMKSRGVTEEVAEEVDAKKEAELIFERFKKGEKLSTEDLLTLQKSGYL